MMAEAPERVVPTHGLFYGVPILIKDMGSRIAGTVEIGLAFKNSMSAE